METIRQITGEHFFPILEKIRLKCFLTSHDGEFLEHLYFRTLNPEI